MSETYVETSEANTHSETEETLPIPPEKLFFDHKEYSTICKVASKCNTYETIGKIMEKLKKSSDQMKWFTEHPQFCNIFHMFRERFHKTQAMYALLVRTTCTSKEREVWFIVNGAPIRYSLREHALISGLDCKSYPKRYEKLGSFVFVKRMFGRKDKIDYKDVQKKFRKIKGDGSDRLKLAVLLFLCTVVKMSSRADQGYVDPFFLRIVDDLDACRSFPWGRYTFDDCITEIQHMMNNLHGNAQKSWTFPGFIIPLEQTSRQSLPHYKKQVYLHHPDSMQNRSNRVFASILHRSNKRRNGRDAIKKSMLEIRCYRDASLHRFCIELVSNIYNIIASIYGVTIHRINIDFETIYYSNI